MAATLLALLFSCAQMLQERLDLSWPDWALRDGKAVAGEMRDFDWSSKALILSVDGGDTPRRVAAEDLGFWSKLRMLCSAPYYDRLSNNLDDLESNPGFRSGVERLERLALIFVGAYVFLFSTLNWLLAGWILRSGSVLRWLASGLVFVFMTVLAGAAVTGCVQKFGPNHFLEYLGLAAGVHTVFYVALVWGIYRSGPFRATLWYALCWLVALSLPFTLGGTALSAQVYRSTGALNLMAWDSFLTEGWLRPMGLL